MSSQKRIDANRRNAQNSTGPRTKEGKDRSRLNALKHGLRAEEIMLPTEDPQAFKEHLEAWINDWQPPSMARRHLVEQAAVATWRIRRCNRLETARITERVEEAYEEFDQDVAAEVDEDFARLDEDPVGALEDLTATRPGVDRLIEEWNAIGDAATSPEGWYDQATHDRLIHLHGLRMSDPDARELRILSMRLLKRNLDDAEEGPLAPFDDIEAEEACDTIRALAARKADELERLRATLPDVKAERDRFAELEAYAPRPEDAILLRYEGQQQRLFKTSLDGLMRLSKTGADVMEEVSPNEATEVEPPTAVSPNEATAVEAKPAGRWASEPVAPNEATAEWPDVPVDRVKRGPDGGIWSTVPVPIDA
jgi:hypothetical protein